MPSSAIFAADPAKGWRPWGALVPVLGVAFVILATAPFTILLQRLHLIDPATDDPVGLWGFLAFLVGPFGLLTLVVLAWVRFVEQRPWRTIGLTAPGALRFGGGLLTGVLMMGATVGGIWLTGALTAGAIAPAFASGVGLASIAALLAAFAVQASAEELLFRGWMLSALAAKFGTVAAVVVTSAVFALLHYERNASPLFAFNIVLFAFFACSWALRTGRIWGAMGWHTAWNWLLGVGFGLRVTGLDTHMPALLVKLTPAGPDWLTGGAEGSEGSIVCTIVLAVGIAWNVWRKRRRAWLSTPDSRPA